MLEQAFIGQLKELSYAYVHGWELSPESGERDSYRQTVLKKRFLSALRRLNPWISGPKAGLLYREVADLETLDFAEKGKIFREMLLNGVKLKEKGQKSSRLAKFIDFDRIDENEFLCANQFAVEAPSRAGAFRRSDLVVFVNGLPLVLFEFKSFQAHETVRQAFSDHQAKMAEIPQLYACAQLLVASDGLETRYGASANDWDGFFSWEGVLDEADLEVNRIREDLRIFFRKSTGEEMTGYEVLLEGLFRKENLLEYLRDFVFFEKIENTPVRKAASFRHFYLTRKAMEKTEQSVLSRPGENPGARPEGIGVIRQGSDRERILAMLFFAKRALKKTELENPLLIFLTDRKEFRNQISNAMEGLPAPPVAHSLKELRSIIKTNPGGMAILLIHPLSAGRENEAATLSDRRNILVIAEEAYNKAVLDFGGKLKSALPNASFIGFTALPEKLQDPSTPSIFGEPIGGPSTEKPGKKEMGLKTIMASGFWDFVKTLWGEKRSSAP